MASPGIIAIFNGAFLIIAVVIIGLMIRATVEFNWAYGDGDKQNPIRNRFLVLLLLVILVGFIAAIGNIILISL